jgi:ketosteroid isomerase-like protein
MDHAMAQKFADSWAQGWNAHDLEGVLGHFADDVVFSSPAAAQLISGSDGVVRGKAALRDYWAEGLRRIPDLHFTVLDVYAGVSAVVINYRNQKGAWVSEVLIFDGPLVVEGHGTYLGTDPNPVGATAS